MADLSDVQRDLEILAADLKRLEAEYNMFFAGRLPRPPWETRNRVSAMVKRYDRGRIEGTGDRFRFEMLQSRFAALADLWDRGLRAREEGRPGPFAQPPHTLYDSLMDARRTHGEDVVPFHKFAALVKNQVTKLREAGNNEVAFRVAVKDGKVAFTVRGLKGSDE